MTMKAICGHVHVSDNREGLSAVQTIWLLVDAMLHYDVNDERAGYFHDKSDSPACSCER